MRQRYRYDKDLDAIVPIYDHNGPETATFHGVMPDIRPFALPTGETITSRSHQARILGRMEERGIAWLIQT